jgi:Spy/CpxP family protein refolding chaperone
MKNILKILVLLCITGSVFGQFEEAKGKKMREKLMTVKIWEMSERLDLSDEQAIKLFPIMRKQKAAIDSLKGEVENSFKKIRELVDSKANEKKISAAIEDYKNAKIMINETEIEYINKISEVLTPQKVAKYLIFEREFRRKMMDIIKQRRIENQKKQRRQNQ